MIAGLGVDGEPAVAADLVLELAGAPSRCSPASPARASGRRRWPGPRARPCWWSSPARRGSTASSCTWPRLGLALARAARSRARSAPGRRRTPAARPGLRGRACSSTFSNRFFSLMSIGLLITRPERALLGVLAQVDHRAGKACRPAMPGMAIRNWLRQVDSVPGMSHFIPRHCRDSGRQAHRHTAAPWTSPWTGAGLVPARPARRRPCRAVPRAARGPRRCGAPSSSTATSSTRCRAPTGASSSSATAWSALDAAAARAGQLARHRGRRADRAPRPCRSRRSPALAAQLGVQAVYANHDDDPVRAGARRPGARRAGRRRRRAAHRQGPCGLRAHEVLTGGGKPYSVFTPYKNAWLKKLDAVLPEGLPGGAPCRRAGGAAGADCAGRCRRWPTSASSPPTCTR